jgi:hypothetical protein
VEGDEFIMNLGPRSGFGLYFIRGNAELIVSMNFVGGWCEEYFLTGVYTGD